jgi:hypothetical protein
LGKNVKVVELPQFKSFFLGGLSVTFETLEVKVQNGWIVHGVKCNFPKKLYYCFGRFRVPRTTLKF